MFCRKCGNEIPDDSEFCPKCGEKIEVIEENEEVQQAVEAVNEPVQVRSSKPVTNGNELCSVCEPDLPKDEALHTEKANEKSVKKESKKKVIFISIGAVAAAVVAIMLVVFYPIYSTLHKEYGYIINDDKVVVITGYHGEDTDIVIPNIIKGKPVKVIEESAFKDSNITSVQLNDDLEIIGSSTFANCSGLKEVTMPGKSIISSVGDEAFRDCTSLTSIKIETLDNTIDVGEKAFYNCYSLTSIPFYGDLCPLGVGAFENCTSLKDAVLYKAAISPRCFAGCSSLESVECEISGGIGYEAFSGCENLAKITVEGNTYTNPNELFNNGRVVYGEDAFLNCGKFKYVEPMLEYTPGDFIGKDINDAARMLGAEYFETSYQEYSSPGLPTFRILGKPFEYMLEYSYDISTVTFENENMWLTNNGSSTDQIHLGMSRDDIYNLVNQAYLESKNLPYEQRSVSEFYDENNSKNDSLRFYSPGRFYEIYFNNNDISIYCVVGIDFV